MACSNKYALEPLFLKHSLFPPTLNPPLDLSMLSAAQKAVATFMLKGKMIKSTVNPVFEAALVLEAALWVQANCLSLLQVS